MPNEILTRAEAIEKGRKRYYPGTPCKKYGHVAERFTSNGGCILCANPLKAKAHQRSRDTQPWQPTFQVPYWLVAAHFAVLHPMLQEGIDVTVKAWIAEAEAARHAPTDTPQG